MVHEVIIYTKDTCPHCHRAIELLQQQGLSYTRIELLQFPEKRDEMIKRANGATTVPQIFIDGVHRGGCDDLYEYFEKYGTLIGEDNG